MAPKAKKRKTTQRKHDDEPGTPVQHEEEGMEVEPTEESESDNEIQEMVRHPNNRKYIATSVGKQSKTGTFIASGHGVMVSGTTNRKNKDNNSTVEQNDDMGTEATSSTISSKLKMVAGPTRVQLIMEKNTEMYKEQLKESGNMQDPKFLEEYLRRHVTQTLFCKLKFITSESQLDHGGKIAERIMSSLRIVDSKKKSFWDTHRSFINGWLRVKRNNVILQVKDAFFSK